MTDLSPAAQTVLDVAEAGLDGYIELLPPTWKFSVSATLRAAADLLRPDPGQSYQVGGIRACQSQLRAIAAELEAQ